MKIFLLLSCLYTAFYTYHQNPQAVVEKLGSDFPENTQLSIALLEGETVQYYGFHKKEGRYVPVSNQQAVFEIGSLTKLFTSTLLAQAIIDKKVKPQQRLRSLLPFALKGRPKITLEQLANHSSGLPRLPENIFPLLLTNATNPYKEYDEALLEAYATKELRLATAPGEQFAYSNLGAGFLGYALTRAYKTPYQTLLQEFIFDPLDMPHTYAHAAQVPAEQLVLGQDPTGSITPNWDWQVLASAGSILSCTEDLSRYARAQLTAESAVFERQQRLTFEHNKDLHLALGWLILTKKGREYYFHNGATGGYTSSMVLDKAQQKAVVILSNLSGMHAKREQIDAIAFQLLQEK